jgi:hypothetical protein
MQQQQQDIGDEIPLIARAGEKHLATTVGTPHQAG